MEYILTYTEGLNPIDVATCWRMNNKAKTREYFNNYYKREGIREKILVKLKVNNDKILEKNQVNRLICDCGSNIQFKTRLIHYKTQKHVKYLKSCNTNIG